MKYIIFIILLLTGNIIYSQNKSEKSDEKESVFPPMQVLLDDDNDGISVGNELLNPNFIWNEIDPITLEIIEYEEPVHKFAKARDVIKLQEGFSYTAIPDAKFSAKTDQTIILPATDHYAEFSSIDFSAFDMSLPVGSINGSFNVTPTGAATYSMQIEVPQGIQGLQPNLSVSYNSMAGMSNMGKGFSLSGVSAITRTNQTPYYDDKWEEVDFMGDKFMLDGQRLIVTNSLVYGADGTEYGTESYSPIKVTSYGRHGNGSNNPRFFEVQNAAGQTLTYGQGGNSFHKVGGFEDEYSPAYMWLLHEVKDKNDNKMLYHYGVRDGEHYIQKIEYINNGSEYLGEIEFIHEEHGHPQIKNVGGEMFNGYINQTLLLKEIRVNLNGKSYRRYEFDYFEDILPKLYQATVFDGNGNKLNSTKFDWGGVLEDQLDFEVESLCPSSGDNISYFPCDFDGNGRTDLLKLLDYSNGFTMYKTLQFYQAGSSQQCDNFKPLGSFNFGYPDIVAPLFCDFDGDGKDDILYMTFNSSNGGNYNDGDYTFHFVNNVPPFGSTHGPAVEDYGFVMYEDVDFNNYDNYPGPFYLTGDFDGDGKYEICFNDDHHLRFLKYDETNFIQEYSNISFDGKPGNDDPYPLVGDFNGDGIHDIFFVQDSEVKVFTFEDDLTTIKKISELDLHAVFNDIRDPKLADINGDGKSDLFFRIPGYNWKMAISNGEGFSVIDFDEIDGINLNADEHELYFTDVNSDGITDIVHVDNGIIEKSGTVINFYFGDNSFKFKKLVWEEPTDLGNFKIIKSMVDGKDVMTDMNGDGFVDFLIDGEGWHETLQLIKFSFDPATNPNNIKNIKNGLNNNIQIQYKSGLKLVGIEEHENENIHSLRHRTMRMVSNTNTIGANITYTYGPMFYHKQGKGFLGTKSFGTYNSTTKQRTETEFTINSDFFVNYVSSVTNKLINETVSSSSSVYEFVSINNQFYQKLDKSISTDELADIQTETSYTYNNTYKVKTVTSEISKSGGAAEKTVLVENFYVDESGLTDNRIDYKTTTTTIGANSHTQTTDYSYDGNWNITANNVSFGDGRFLNKAYSEFVKGNPGKVVTSGTNMDHIQTDKFEYDNSKRFVTKHTLPNNDFTTSSLDPFTDLVLSKTDATGKTISMRYGKFGALEESIDAFGNSTTFSSSYTSENNAFYKKTVKTAGMGIAVEYFNERGQSVLKETPGANGTVQTRKEYYDEAGEDFGKQKLVYEPSYGAATEIAAEYWYDDYGRVDYVISKNDNNLTTDYEITSSSLTTTVTQPNGLYQTTQSNAWGGTISVTDNGGTINYSGFSALGMPKYVSYSGASWWFNYDDQGHRTRLNDPDAGVREFVYDAIGNIKSKQLPSNEIVGYEYDELNRLKKKTNTTPGEGEINYSYVQTGNGKGQLKSIVNYNSIDYNMTYNSDDRVSKKTYDIVGEQFNVEYEYDELGRTTLKTLPDGTTIGYSYYETDGSIKEIFVNGNVVAKDIIYDAKDRVTNMDLGSVMNFSQEFNKYDYPTFRKIELDGNPIFHQLYIFDEKENWLLMRKDVVKSIIEKFAYDDQQRLIRSVVNNVVQIDMGYYLNGNIDYKNDVGTYQYENGNHAVTNISPLDESYFNDLGGFTGDTVQDISYNSFNKPVRIEFGSHVMNIEYGPDKHRRHFVLTQDGTKIWECYYADDFIYDWRNGQERTIVTVAGPDGLLGLNITENDESYFYYAATDYLGSLLALYTPEGNLMEEYNYDAWGRRRNADTWTYDNVQTPTLTRIGYTGHEHWDELQLINMTGRMYDARIARFLSTDPYVQIPGNTQNLNRYAYALNNPLIYSDPDGEFIVGAIIVGALVGAYTGGMIANGGEKNPLQWELTSGETWGYMAAGALIGGAAGAAGGAAGSAAMKAAGGGIAGGIAGGAIGGMSSGVINGGGMAALAGGSKSDIFRGMSRGFMLGTVTGAVGGGLFAGAHKLLNSNATYLLPVNTISYMTASTGSQVAANLITNKRAFKGNDFGFNMGIISPLNADRKAYSSNYIEKKLFYNEIEEMYRNPKTTKVTRSKLFCLFKKPVTTLNSNGDLTMQVQFKEHKHKTWGIFGFKWPYIGVDRHTFTKIYQPDFQSKVNMSFFLYE